MGRSGGVSSMFSGGSGVSVNVLSRFCNVYIWLGGHYQTARIGCNGELGYDPTMSELSWLGAVRGEASNLKSARET
jgi:hypothetical protein